MTGLTPRQSQALTFIDRHIAEVGYSPSYDEIAAGVGYRSKGTAHTMISALVERGYVRRRHDRNRTLEVIRRPPGAELPLPGPAALARASDDELERLVLDLDLEQFARRRDQAIARADAVTGSASA